MDRCTCLSLRIGNVPPPRFQASATPRSSSTAKMAAAVAFGAMLLFAGTVYFAQKKKREASLLKLESSIKLLLPTGEKLQKIVALKGGWSNDLWRVYTERHDYIFRVPKKRDNPATFQLVLDISQKASTCGIAPTLIGANAGEQQLLLEHIEHTKWPVYAENPAPYQAAMKVLRSFHEKMQPLSVKAQNATYAPFTLVFNETAALEKIADIPAHFSTALEKTKLIFKKLNLWLEKHATLCHGDFHKGNALLPKDPKAPPKLIDFDSAAVGHPFFDVVKFSLTLSRQERLELFSAYLGKQTPNAQELAHFELIDLALLMVIAALRFKSASTASGERLSKTELEKMLDAPESLPSFLQIPFGNTSAKARQEGATYALGEFLSKTSNPAFKEWLGNA